MADDEMAEDAEGAEAGDSGAEEGAAPSALEAPPAKPKSDMFSLLLVMAFAAFLVGTLLAANELHDFYDVQFWMFTKK